MIVRVASTSNRVSSRGGWSSSTWSQPSSKATRFSRSKRPVSLLAAPRPLRALTVAGICMIDHAAPMRTLQEPILLSAIIPTLNEAARLPAALAALQSRRRGDRGRRTEDRRRHGEYCRSGRSACRRRAARPRQPARGRSRRRVRRLAAVSACRLPSRSRLGGGGSRLYRRTGRGRSGRLFCLRAGRPEPRRRGGWSASCDGAARCWRCLTATRDC